MNIAVMSYTLGRRNFTYLTYDGLFIVHTLMLIDAVNLIVATGKSAPFHKQHS